ncbi:MAG: glycosyltransferase, partial [Oxalobacteraceae bacterium]
MTRSAVIIIPTLNEARRIGDLLDQLTRLPATLVPEILVADGRSTDATRTIVADRAARDPRIRLVDNAARLQAAGINLAVMEARSDADTIVRIDAHAVYSDDFVPQVMARFTTPDITMVAVRLDTRGETCMQHGIAAAMNSRLGTGGSAHRVGGFSGFVDHGHHAGINRAMFCRVGGYDPSFRANEDAELDY